MDFRKEMILSAQSIRARKGMIIPFSERGRYNGYSYGLSSAGYDISIAQTIHLPPHGFRLASAVERFDMPNDVLGRVTDKSTWARQGLAVQNTVIEPGWRGYLTLELSNNTDSAIVILCGTPIAQVIFELLDQPTEIPYEGKYQDQPAGAVKAILENGRSSELK